MPAPKQKTAEAQQDTSKANCIKQQRKPGAKPTILTARAQQNFSPATSLTKTYKNQTKSCASPAPSKNFKHANSTPRFSCHRKQKTRKSNGKLLEAQLQQKAAQARREIKQSTAPFFLTPLKQKLRKPNRRPQKHNSKKQLSKPDAKQKNKPCEPNKNVPGHRSNKNLCEPNEKFREPRTHFSEKSAPPPKHGAGLSFPAFGFRMLEQKGWAGLEPETPKPLSDL